MAASENREFFGWECGESTNHQVRQLWSILVCAEQLLALRAASSGVVSLSAMRRLHALLPGASRLAAHRASQAGSRLAFFRSQLARVAFPSYIFCPSASAILR